MRLCYVTDSLGNMPFESMLDEVRKLGVESLEIACGNWSQAPHINLDLMLESEEERKAYVMAIEARGMSIEALNCSGNQLAPNEEGKKHQDVVEKTFKLAYLLGVKKIIMMSGLPGGGPGERFPNWISTSWPPITTEILKWQWEEIAIPYWQRTVKLAKECGIEKIALENHGCQLVYNPDTLLKLRREVGDTIGMNFDPSHLLWMGGDPFQAIYQLSRENAIYHVHAKDVRIERINVGVNGLLDTNTIDKFATRSWNYVALGHGNDLKWWKEFFSVLRMLSYDGPVSLEMEDMTMDPLVGVKKSLSILKQALPRCFDNE